jgi:hypothetical protein
MDYSFLHIDNMVVMILSAGAVYGAIRSDIKNIHEQIQRMESGIDSAHRRLDDILMKH